MTSANGMSGTVATPTTTPAITLTTTVTGMIRGNGTSLFSASPGTDYSLGTSGNPTGIVKSSVGTGTLTTAVAADFPCSIKTPPVTLPQQPPIKFNRPRYKCGKYDCNYGCGNNKCQAGMTCRPIR